MSKNSNIRSQVIDNLSRTQTRKFDWPLDEKGKRRKVSDFFGCNTFNLTVMKQKLPKDVFNRISKTINEGLKLELTDAEAIANAVKDWAVDHGVTHFCHWFQPQTGTTAEKHDSFITTDHNNLAIEKLSGGQLIQSEPDASSFPSGGMRTTFEARGYTAWDPASPIFIVEHTNGKTLCIPSVFISYHGHVLDEKSGLLKSMDALSKKATELLQLFGENKISRVVPTLGIEQEYFLIDRSFYNMRMDLVMTGRTMLGQNPPKGQQLEDHYFGSIPSRVVAFMSEFEFELYKLGVPVKTRHNEVAPSQFETAPIFELANIATDHNQITMETLRKVANRHHFAALLHEKPFSGINGSGKHNNWSLLGVNKDGMSEGENLLDPGKTPNQNVRFLLFLAGVLKGVHKHAGLLRAGIASPGNDHRLGANEAPPAIISVFLGDLLNQVLNEIESGALKQNQKESAILSLGTLTLPNVMKDNTDRNRTSPFAFTGNKFEFRAVGSSAAPAFAITLLNSAVADGISYVTQKLKQKGKDKLDNETIMSVIKEVVKETKDIRFEGNNYSDEWVQEAAKRGLPNLKKTPEALEKIKDKSSIDMLVGLGVFTEEELHSRYHVIVERYTKHMLIEVETLVQMVDSIVIPGVLSYVKDNLSPLMNSQSQTAGFAKEQDSEIGGLLNTLMTLRKKLDVLSTKIESMPEEKKAVCLAYDISAVMMEIRDVVDKLESKVGDSYWPLPKYREMLFLN